MEEKIVVSEVAQGQHGSSAPGEPAGKAQHILMSAPIPRTRLILPEKPKRLPSPLLAQGGPGKGRGTGTVRNRRELPCGIAGLAFFAGATSSALDSEKDAVLLGAGVWGGTRRGSKSHR